MWTEKCYLIVEDDQVSQAGFAFDKSVLAFPKHFLYLATVYKRTYSITLPGIVASTKKKNKYPNYFKTTYIN